MEIPKSTELGSMEWDWYMFFVALLKIHEPKGQAFWRDTYLLNGVYWG